ncbi:SDR family NAD(P)-dependent oxidoreductase [Actinoplanes sp. CA-054009]
MGKALEGKVAVVTGSGQGVGKGIAILLAREGAKIVTNGLGPSDGLRFRASALPGAEVSLTDEEKAHYDSLASDAEATAEQIISEGGEAVACYADITDHAAAGTLIQTAVDTFGRVDILVNNAAALGFGPFTHVSEADWKHLLDAKLNGTYNCMSHAVPHMIRQGYGRILNASSDAWTGIASLAPYSAANAGVVALTKSTAKELARHGITVNVYCPQAASPGHVGFTATLRTTLAGAGVPVKIDEERMRASEEAHGPAENLTFLAYLATEEASFINGAVFSVTGDGQVALYSEPVHVSRIKKDGAVWTVDELSKQVPDTLLRDYVSVVENREF